MERIKESAVANSFYPGDVKSLSDILKSFVHEKIYEYETRAVIVPHAGLIYSGKLAFEGISLLNKNIKNIIIFAPAHRVAFDGLALTGYDKWKTPLGLIRINQQVNQELEAKFNAKINDEAHREEHSIEIQLPILQYLYKDIQIIPVLIGRQSPDLITDIINEYYSNEDFGFIISSDLSHFLTDDKAKELDYHTAQMIETGNINSFKYEQACGAVGIYGLVEFANKHNYSLIRTDMNNSSVVTGDKSRVVGYGTWFLYEGSKNKFIKEKYSDFMLKLCRDVIKSRYTNEPVYTNAPPVFDEAGACFVTLKKNNNLRGCIGSIIAHQALINDLILHAEDSAYRDPRFSPVQFPEIAELKIDISLLSAPKPMQFKDEEDLLNQMIPYKDGIIIRDKDKQAVYLPSVWEEIPDKKMFLQTLKMKAGMNPDHFSDTFEAFRFETEYIEEK